MLNCCQCGTRDCVYSLQYPVPITDCQIPNIDKQINEQMRKKNIFEIKIVPFAFTQRLQYICDDDCTEIIEKMKKIKNEMVVCCVCKRGFFETFSKQKPKQSDLFFSSIRQNRFELKMIKISTNTRLHSNPFAQIHCIVVVLFTTNIFNDFSPPLKPKRKEKWLLFTLFYIIIIYLTQTTTIKFSSNWREFSAKKKTNKQTIVDLFFLQFSYLQFPYGIHYVVGLANNAGDFRLRFGVVAFNVIVFEKMFENMQISQCD